MKQSIRQLTAVFLALLFIAAACGSDTSSTETTDAPTTEGTGSTDAPTTADPGGTEATTTEATGSTEATGGGGETYDDPRGGIFSDFQAGFDRSHPFQSLDDFCLPTEATEELIETGPGITADEIQIVQIRSKLEDFEDIGFGIPVGDPNDMFTKFVEYTNENCNGIRGRRLNLTNIDVDVLGAEVDQQRNAACVDSTEDRNAVVVLNSTGFQGTAILCLVEDHETIFVTTQGVNDEWTNRGEGRLVSVSVSLEESLIFLGQALIETGELEGKTIGVVMPDTPGQPEAMTDGLVTPLRDAGLDVAVVSTIGCDGGTTCASGSQESVTEMLDAGVDVIFPGLNVVSLPGYISEMVAQGFQPGEVQFYNSNFNSQAGDLVSSKVVAFGGEDAGNLYNGAIIVDSANTGFIRDPDSVISPMAAMCLGVYEGMGGEVHDPFDPETTAANMVTGVCSQLRVAFRAIYDAGDNPTVEDVHAALRNLGPVDVASMNPSSISEGKYTMPDAIHTMVFQYPCPQEGLGFGAENTCVNSVEGSEYELVERG